MKLRHVTLPRASRSMYHEWNEKDKLDVSLENLIFNSAFPKARDVMTAKSPKSLMFTEFN